MFEHNSYGAVVQDHNYLNGGDWYIAEVVMIDMTNTEQQE